MVKKIIISLLICLFLFVTNVHSQSTYDFSTSASLSYGTGGSGVWNTQANITIGGVEYILTSGGNGSFVNSATGGVSNGKCLKKDGSGGDSFTLKRADGQPFQFYSIWVSHQSMNSYSTSYTLPPWYTLSATGNSFTDKDMTAMTPGTNWNNYTSSSRSISAGTDGVAVTAVQINFQAILYYSIDDIKVGPPVVGSTSPTATIVLADNALTIGETSLVTITFSEAVTGFTIADLTIANGTLSAVSSSDGGITWTATFTPTAGITDATNVITLANTGVTNAAGNAGTGTTDSNNYTIDTQRPTATIVVADNALRIGETSLVTITFSEAVTGFTNADLPIANGTLSAVSSSDGGITWTATFTPTAGITDATNVITLANAGVADAAGNAGSGTTDSNNYSIDTSRPTATIVVADNALRIGETSLVTITFSEAVTGFTNGDLTIVNGTLSAVSSSDGGITWTATFTPTAGITDATNFITLANAGVADAAGNAGSGTTDSNNYSIDTSRPTATIVVADNALRIGETSLVTITFSEAVTGFTNGDLTIANGTSSAVSSSDGGITWTTTLTPTAGITDATNVITLNNTGLADASGNVGTGTTDSNNYTIDTQRPTATIVVADNALRIGETSLVTITFSEAVTGFTNGDLTIANGTSSAVSSSDGGITWTTTLTPNASVTDATNVITLANTGVADASGNVGTGTTDSNNYTIDTQRPTATIFVADNALRIGETSLVTITFSEAVTGFTNGDLTIANGTSSAVSSSDGGITWTTSLTPTAGITDATNVITLNNTGVADSAGNAGSGTTDSNNYGIDTLIPIVASVSVPANGKYVGGENLEFTIVFNKEVKVITIGGIPQIQITIGEKIRQANYVSGSETNSLLFRYTIQSGDLDSDGITVGPLQANNGILSDIAGNNAILTLNNVPLTTNVLIDATIAPTITFENSSKTYGDANFDLVATSNSQGTINYAIISGGTGAVTLSGANNETVALETAGTVTIRATQIADGIYTSGSKDITLTITPKAITVTAAAKSKTYGEPDPALTYDFAPALVTGDTFSGGISRSLGQNAGSYAINQGTLALNSNYSLTYVGADLTIGAKTITVTAAAKSKTYGEADPALTYTFAPALVTGDTFSGSLTRSSGENIGTYAINQNTLALSSNYTLTYVNADLTIAKKTIAVTAAAKKKTYGDADPALTYTFAPSLVAGDSFSGSLSRLPGGNVGTYAINQGTLGLSSNYTLTYVDADLTIGAKTITVTAAAKSKTYGDADPALTYTFAPALVTGDSFSGSLSRLPGENVGTYAINQGTLGLSSNYTLTYVGADLTIGAKTITVTATAKSKTYGEADPALTYTFAPALVTGDSFNGSLTRSSGENIGTYAINQNTLALSSNYILTYIGDDLTIGAKTITVTAAAKSKTYGDADPALTYTFAPTLVTGDNFTGSLTRSPGQNVGTYAINQGTVALNGNYTLAYVASNFSITAKPITVTANASQSKVYGTADPVYTYSVSPALVSGDSYTGALTRAAGNNAGTYQITQGTLSAGTNYTLTYMGNNFTIVKANQTITWNQTLGFGCEGESTVVLTATSNSGLPVNYASSNSNIATILNGVLVFKDYGSVVITASQAGNNNYNAAPVVALSVVNSQPNLIRKQFEDIIFFDNSSNSFKSYSWYKNGVLVPSETTQYFKENGALNGTYYAIATKLDGTLIKTCSLTLSPTVEEEYIKIVPNPVKTNSSYELVTNVSSLKLKNAHIEVFSIGGLLVENKTTNENTVTLKAPTVEGIYIVRMTLANGKYFTKNLLVKN